jgi:hypothetical protein
MIEFLIGIIVGVALAVYAVRRYNNRDGQVADIVRRVTGVTKGV